MKLEAHAFTREAVIETFKRAYKDAFKTDFEDANSGTVIWGHMSRQSGLVLESVPTETLMAPGFPQSGYARFDNGKDG
jgi:hypothetical protein